LKGCVDNRGAFYSALVVSAFKEMNVAKIGQTKNSCFFMLLSLYNEKYPKKSFL
jgi:hypothetical protein